MGMPNNLILVRHGESEGNIATARSRRGDHSAYDGPFKKRHSSQWRLSKEGQRQAQITGEWINNKLGLKFDRFYTSTYLRAKETAALLDIPDAKWYPELYLRERYQGDLEKMSVAERAAHFEDSLEERKNNPLYWAPPNGQPLADKCLDVDRIFDTMHRECNGKNVIIVCHGEVMWAFRLRLERLSDETFFELTNSKNPLHQIHNCQVIHYTRTNPREPGASPSKHLDWMRSVCPWDDLLVNAPWTSIYRPSFSNLDLLNQVEKVKPLIIK